MKLKDAIARIQELHEPDDEVAIFVWCIEDVEDCAEQMGQNISREQAIEVLERMKHKHDCSIGINWDVIEGHIYNVA